MAHGLLGLLQELMKSSTPTSSKESKNYKSATKYEDQPYLPKVGELHRIVGLNYREDNVLKLAKENQKYQLDKTAIIKQGLIDAYIHKYIFEYDTAELVQEPDNAHDPNAIKVMVGGQHIGYIKAGSCARVNKLINGGNVEKVLCRISGGPYKRVYQDIDELMDGKFHGKPTYRIESKKSGLFAEIRIVAITV